MLKKSFATLLAALAIGNINAASSRIETKSSKVNIKGTELVKIDRNIYLPTAKIMYVTHNQTGQKLVFKKGWGQYFFGLEFGRLKGTNGSWSLWNFFKFYSYTPEGHYNLMDKYLPEAVTMIKLDDGALALFRWGIGADGKEGNFELRAMQLNSHPKWLFIQVKLSGKSKQIRPNIIILGCYPGNSVLAKQGERHLMTKEKDYNLSVKKFSMTPTSPGMAFYSKFDLERFGNYLILEPEKFEKIEFSKFRASVEPRLFPKQGEREFRFALSYFMDKSPADELPRFTNETSDAIYKFMENIDFYPKVEIKPIDTLAVEVKNLLKNNKSQKQTAEVDDICKKYRAAAKAGKRDECRKLRQSLEKIKKAIVGNSMSQFL